MTKERRPILYKGESYSKPVTKGGGGPPKEPKITFDQAKEQINKDLDATIDSIRSISQEYKLPNELVLCFRLHPDFTAKSSFPTTLFPSSDKPEDLVEIGSRIWKKDIQTETGPQMECGKLIFVKTNEAGIRKFKQKLNGTVLPDNFKRDIRKLTTINLLEGSEQVLGFDKDWTKGRIEAVIHPLGIDKEAALSQFKKIISSAGADLSSFKFKRYEEGVTFISVYGNKEIVNALRGYYPLRTVHPIIVRELPILRDAANKKSLPNPPVFTKKPSITLGVIDGGYIKGNSYLDKYVDYEESVTEPAHDDYMEHGTQVTGAALYGALNKYKSVDQLTEPTISVKNFRVLSSTGTDPDLYETIDAIEKIIPANKNILVYNLSLGPSGPILDDHISRFTFACDLLSKKYGVLFCVAVGNDGEVAGYDRIQSPSDMVNGLAVGAYSLDVNGEKERASYSCVGPGREGNKLKPDITAFGGCETTPIQVISSKEGFRSYTAGTSFSNPLVAAPTTELIGSSKNTIDTLVARALMIHSTEKKKKAKMTHCLQMGHGTLPDNIEDVVVCPDKSYTLIYQGEIRPGSFVEYSIPWPDELISGKIDFHWTLAVLTNVDPLSPDDYTTTSIETAFYPNSHKFTFSRDGDKDLKIDVDEEPQKAAKLLQDGWEQSSFPNTDPKSKQFIPEKQLRADLKWDSVERRMKSKTSGVKAPLFHVHALKRNKKYNSEKVKFALILTVGAPKSAIDLYAKVVAKYPVLLPLKVDIKNRVHISK